MTDSDDYERALLGVCLQGHRDIPGLIRLVSGDDFRTPMHQAIWQAVIAVHASGAELGVLNVRDHLGAAVNRMPGGPLYLSNLYAEPYLGSADWLAERVKGDSIRRQVMDIAVRTRQLADDLDADPLEMPGRVEAWAEKIGHRPTGRRSLADAFETVVDVAENGTKSAVPTGWDVVDEMVNGGWYPGLIVVGARPGVGKSLFLEGTATSVARSGKRVAFISLEMSAVEILQRTAAYTARIELSKLRRGGALSEVEWRRLNEAHTLITAAPLDLYDDPHQTVDSIRAAAWEARQTATRNGQELGLVVIDYLQLVTPRDNRLTRQQQVGEMSRGLKKLSRELDIPVIAAAQLNRDAQHRVPMLSDLREAGDIEQDSDVVVLLHEQTIEDQNGRVMPSGQVDVMVAKNRHGEQKTLTLTKYGHFGRLAA